MRPHLTSMKPVTGLEVDANNTAEDYNIINVMIEKNRGYLEIT